MKLPSNIHDITKDLEQHENSPRIKKLIFYVCTNNWINDPQQLEQLQFPELIHQLCNLNPTIEELKYNLSTSANTLSKPDEYTMIANIIVNKLEEIYVENEEVTTIKSPKSPENLPQKQQIKNQYNPFDLRQNIMRLANPLRAKIVLFSAVYYKFNFKSEDWSKLRLEQMDSLLWKLFNSCATWKQVESKINSSIRSLGNDDESIQAGSTIMRFMENLYEDVSSSNQYENNESFLTMETIPLATCQNRIAANKANHKNQDEDDFDNDFEHDFDDNNTCQVIELPRKNA